MFTETGGALHFTRPTGALPLRSPLRSSVSAYCCPLHVYDPLYIATHCAFARDPVHAAAGNNTYAIYGHGVNKDLAEMMPNVLSQLGPDALATLRQIAEQYQRQQAQAGGAADEAGEPDDEVPELVEAAEPAVRRALASSERSCACTIAD